jgi:hypothetical protein
MKEDSNATDRDWLLSLGFDKELIDSPSGTRMIQMLFDDGVEEDHWIEETVGADRGFACVA